MKQTIHRLEQYCELFIRVIKFKNLLTGWTSWLRRKGQLLNLNNPFLLFVVAPSGKVNIGRFESVSNNKSSFVTRILDNLKVLPRKKYLFDKAIKCSIISTFFLKLKNKYFESLNIKYVNHIAN